MTQSKFSSPKSSRRGFVTWSATAGAAVAAATTMPLVASAPAVAEPVRPKPERGGGYHASEHIKRYYKTTLV